MNTKYFNNKVYNLKVFNMKYMKDNHLYSELVAMYNHELTNPNVKF